VLRGLEFYRGRLIAYSLGNFAGGGGTLNNAGNLGLGAVLTVSLYPDGAFAGGRLISTHMYEAGLPRPDPQQRSLALVRELTELDFPETGARLGPDGGRVGGGRAVRECDADIRSALGYGDDVRRSAARTGFHVSCTATGTERIAK